MFTQYNFSRATQLRGILNVLVPRSDPEVSSAETNGYPLREASCLERLLELEPRSHVELAHTTHRYRCWGNGQFSVTL